MKALVAFDRTTRAAPLEKAIWALTRGATSARPDQRLDAALAVYSDDRTVRAIIERAAAPVGSTTTAGFGAELGQNLVGDFLGTLAPLSAAAAIMSQGLMVNLGRAAELKLPAREGGASTTVSWVGEEKPIPVREYAFNDDAKLEPKKSGFIIGVSRELARRMGGESVIRTLIREDAAASLDATYFGTQAGDAETHPGMLAGVAAIPGFAGGDRTAIETDLAALSDVVSAGSSGQLVFIVSPRRANRIRIKHTNLAQELTFLPSLAVADGDMIAVDPASWAHGFTDEIEIDATRDAVVHMSDEPAAIVDDSGIVADPVRSYWQTDALAIRMLTDIAFASRRPNAVAWATGLTW